MDRLPTIEPIVGDDKPYNTVFYRDVPDGFRFDDLTFDETKFENIAGVWDDIKEFLNSYFGNWEINAQTFANFFDGLNVSLFENIGQLDYRIGALNLVNPEGGAKTIRTKTGTRQENGTNTKSRTYSDSIENTTEGSNENINLAFSSSNNDPTSKTVDNQTVTNEGSGSESQTDTNAVSGSDSESETIRTDEDTLTFYERVLRLYPNIPNDFVNIFKENFTMHEVLIW